MSEIALSFMLLVGAGLLVKSFMRLHDVSPGFNPNNVLTMRMGLMPGKYKQGEPRVRYSVKRLKDQRRSLASRTAPREQHDGMPLPQRDEPVAMPRWSNNSIVRGSNPPAREPSRSWFMRPHDGDVGVRQRQFRRQHEAGRTASGDYNVMLFIYNLLSASEALDPAGLTIGDAVWPK